MVERAPHPSFFELDRFVLNAQRNPTTAEHVEGCEQCSTYVQKVTSDRPVPNWAKDLSANGKQDGSHRWLRWRWAGGFAGAVAVSLAVLMAVIPSENADVITAKGTPAVGVYIRRNQSVALWDGRAEVLPGDALRLKVVPAGFSHLTVLSPHEDENKTPVRLHDAPVARDEETILSVAWRVDEQPGHEELIVVFSHAELPRGLSVQEIGIGSHGSQNFWSTRLVLKKGGPSEE